MFDHFLGLVFRLKGATMQIEKALINNRLRVSKDILKISLSNYPVDTGRKLNVHKTIRRRPRRLLKVLRMFNLRPVSTGYL